MPCIQGRYWLATISFAHLPTQPILQGDLCYLKGQREVGSGGFEHWQVLAVTSKKVSLSKVKTFLHSTAHVELSRSEAANEYVWKEDTRVAGTQFEIGQLPLSRARKQDWNAILQSAKRGSFDDIPGDVLVRHYGALKRIRVDNMVPIARESVVVNVFYGPTGTGKTRRAHDELGGREYFDKNPLTKWWDGYRGQKLCLIDEFAGRVDIINLLRWLDRYPCTVEVKGFSVPLEAVEFWITSNLSPEEWYPDASAQHKLALRRRLTNVVHMTTVENLLRHWVPDTQ